MCTGSPQTNAWHRVPRRCVFSYRVLSAGTGLYSALEDLINSSPSGWDVTTLGLEHLTRTCTHVQIDVSTRIREV